MGKSPLDKQDKEYNGYCQRGFTKITMIKKIDYKDLAVIIEENNWPEMIHSTTQLEIVCDEQFKAIIDKINEIIEKVNQAKYGHRHNRNQ